MSNKQAKFQEVLGNPLNTHNFVIRMPKLLGDLTILVSSTTFPTEKMRAYVLHYMGETIMYPAQPETSGQWSCKVPESESALIFKKTVSLKKLLWNQKTGIPVPAAKTEIEVVARDMADKELFSCILHGCWIIGRDPVGLNNANATSNWEWDIAFNYDWIEDSEKI